VAGARVLAGSATDPRWRGVSPEITGAVGNLLLGTGLHGRTTRETPVALIHPNPAHNDHFTLYVAVAAVLIALILLSVLYLSGPRELERFGQVANSCRPFIGKMPFC
jgi:hypothetical protein